MRGPQATGCIYRYDPDGSLTVMQKGGVVAGNGLCWSPDNKLLYFVDSYKNVSVCRCYRKDYHINVDSASGPMNSTP